MRSRVRLVLPLIVFALLDITLALLGQPGLYWVGERSTALEANRFAHPFGGAAWLTRTGSWGFAWRPCIWRSVLNSPMHSGHHA